VEGSSRNIIVAIIIGAIIIGGFYYLAETKKSSLELEKQRLEFQQDQSQRESQQALDSERDQMYWDCTDGAYDNYLSNWADACDTNNKEKDCSLPQDTASRLDEIYQNELDLCLELYKK
jgi:hypothetical protein